MDRRRLTNWALIATFITIFITMAWAYVWIFFFLALIEFLTCGLNTKCFAPTMSIPGAIVPALYLPFLISALVARGTGQKHVARIVLFVTVVWGVAFSFWFAWWYELGWRM